MKRVNSCNGSGHDDSTTKHCPGIIIIIIIIACLDAGDIVSVETVVVPQVKGRARPDWTAWSESVDVDSSHAFALRVFYSKSVVAIAARPESRRTSVSNTTSSAAPRLQFIGN